MATHVLTIPGWRPASANRLVGRHWAEARRLKKADADMVAGYAMQARVPEAGGRRRVSVRVEGPRGQVPDADNGLKSLLDALVACRRLRDDSPAWCELGRVESAEGPEARTTITLEDLEA